MMLLGLGLALWYATHLAPIALDSRKRALIASIGDRAYKGGLALTTIAAIALMVIGYQDAGYIWVWTPPGFMVHINNVLMIAALLFFAGGRIPGAIGSRIRHPQFAAIKAWAAAHLMVNGDGASILLFGALLAWAVVALIMTDRRDGKPAMTAVMTVQGMAINAVAAGIAFVAVAWVHGSLLGIWPFPV